jgi:hypothetical protein
MSTRLPAAAEKMLRKLLLIVAMVSLPSLSAAQTIDDGIMMGKQRLFTGNVYTHESWEEYWEGPLKRTNGNVGTVTTKTNSWFANYGVSDRLNLITSVPYVWTHASQGVLHGMNGVQDISVAAKYRLFQTPSALGSLRGLAVVTGGLPLTDYVADFQPLSIGNQSKRFGGRFTLNAQSERGPYLDITSAYTIRSQVKLDRPYYYTDGQLFMTDVVEMPEVFDWGIAGGYLKNDLNARLSFTQQRTLGGGDIRRQDAPFISNRMNFVRLGGMVMYPIPKLRQLAVQGAFAYTVNGRNVGQTTTVTAGVLYTFRFFGSATQ